MRKYLYRSSKVVDNPKNYDWEEKKKRKKEGEEEEPLKKQKEL